MHDAAVGHHCPECVREGSRTVRQVRTVSGARERGSAPYLTYAFIAINVVMFIVQMAGNDIEPKLAMWSPAVADGEYYRLLTSAFLHYGPTHIVLNMWALFVVGPPLENWLGRVRFAVLYLLSALGGSVLVYLLSPDNALTAGASGAVFGLFGATFVVARRLRTDTRWVVAIIAINVVFTLVVPLVSSQNISWQGHLGGLISGALVAAALVYAPRDRRNLVQAGLVAALLVVFAGLIWWRTGVLVAQFYGL